MSSFSASIVEPLDYDFTGFPSTKNPGKNCKGKGTIPEPTHAVLEAYAEGLRDLFGINEGEDAETAMESVQKKNEEGSGDAADTLLELTADLCQHSPTADDLRELPPRILNAFQKWVYRELSDPEVSSAGTRR